MKRTVLLQGKLDMHGRDFWDAITNTKHLSCWAKFVSKSDTCTMFQKDTAYYDITHVLWIPLRIKHIIMECEKEKKLLMRLPLPGGGVMWEEFIIKKKKNETFITATVTFDLKWKIADLCLGNILEKRVLKMLKGSIDTLKENTYQCKYRYLPAMID